MTRKVSSERQNARIIERLYADAQRLDWEHLTARERTDQYVRWMSDPEVGGILLTWMSPEAARVWLKDGPMKEYSRALAGQGPNAKYVDEYTRGPVAIITACMGVMWSMVGGTLGVKPLHCDVTDGQRTVRLIWGPVRDFKHLLWSALDASDVQPTKEVRIAIFETIANPMSREERERCERLGRRCGFLVMPVRIA